MASGITPPAQYVPRFSGDPTARHRALHASSLEVPTLDPARQRDKSETSSPPKVAKMANPNDPPLDEIQWRSPQAIAQLGALHSNTILFYFAESPFFERTSNNAVIMSQAMSNPSMYHYIQTREAFEGRLKTMSGLEFIVGEEPAETGPGMGTGVWVIRKQTRRKQYQDEDEVTIHASYFIVGENIYMAPTLGDILASRIVRSHDQSWHAVRRLTFSRCRYRMPCQKPYRRPKLSESGAHLLATSTSFPAVSLSQKHPSLKNRKKPLPCPMRWARQPPRRRRRTTTSPWRER